jgi:phosphoglycolate phosphatase-like HAD superfamily hydrolase
MVSDSGILLELFRRRFDRAPTDEEIRDIQARYLEELEQGGGEGEALPGAHEFVELLEERGWTIAIATGNWAVAARWKLKAAGFTPRWPMGTADDAMQRTGIIQAALSRTGVKNPRHVAYLGDGKWDREAAGELGLHFVAVGGLDHTHRLDDFSDPDRALGAIKPT